MPGLGCLRTDSTQNSAQAAHKHVDVPKRWHVVSCLLEQGFLAWSGFTLKAWTVENDIY